MAAQPFYPDVAPPEAMEMSRNALNTLNPLPAIAVYQDMQVLEEICTCCEMRNKYKISTVPAGQENKIFADNEIKAFPMIFDARENSSLCCRICCFNLRAFQLGLFPAGTPQNPKWPATQPLMTLDRPFKCTWWCGRLYCPQQIHISAEGRKLGHVEQECRCFDCCCLCTHWARSFNSEGQPVYTFEAPLCGSNCCAPSCCNNVFTIRAYSARDETRTLGMIKSIWPGCNCRGICSESASNFVVNFPKDATPEEKGLFIGSMFLHDFLFFEKKGDS